MAVATTAAEQDFSLEAGESRLAKQGRTVWRFMRLQPLGTLSILFIMIIVAAAIFAPWLNTTGEGKTRVQKPEGVTTTILQGPGPNWWMGTNRGALDMWSRVLYGARPALMIGIGAVGISIVVATTLSLAMGYLRGVVDTILSRVIEIIIAIPGLLWLILFTAAFDRSVSVIMFAIAFIFSPLTTLVLRGNVIQESASTYAESARVVGASNLRIMFRHILPNLLPLAIVNASIIIPAAILAEAGLSFLGLGLDPTEPSWGVDIGPNARAFLTRAPWLVVFPGAALALTVLAFNFLGDSVRDTLDPRLRGSGLI